jgi:3-hydroxyacyl-[acyl-carrier-protein] dehydratase
MPLSSFYSYKIVQEKEGQIKVVISFDKHHELYKGHFPQQPVTPGVILIEMARNILSEYTGTKLMLSSAKELKFISPILPEEHDEIELDIQFEFNEQNITAKCIFGAGEVIFTKLKGSFSVRK